MSVMYGIIKNEYIFGNEHRSSYGIAVYDAPEALGTASVLQSVSDICDDFEAISKLVSACNRIQLSPIHLSDVIEDFLAPTLI